MRAPMRPVLGGNKRHKPFDTEPLIIVVNSFEFEYISNISLSRPHAEWFECDSTPGSNQLHRAYQSVAIINSCVVSRVASAIVFA